MGGGGRKRREATNRRKGKRLGGGTRAARNPPGPKVRLPPFQLCSPRGCVAAPTPAGLVFPGGFAGCSELRNRRNCLSASRGGSRENPPSPLTLQGLCPLSQSSAGSCPAAPAAPGAGIELPALRVEHDRHLTVCCPCVSLAHLQPEPAAGQEKSRKFC